MSLIIICAATASRNPPILSESKARILGPLLGPSENVLCALRYLNSFLLQGPLNWLSGNQERGFDIETFLTKIRVIQLLLIVSCVVKLKIMRTFGWAWTDGTSVNRHNFRGRCIS